MYRLPQHIVFAHYWSIQLHGQQFLQQEAQALLQSPVLLVNGIPSYFGLLNAIFDSKKGS